MAHAGVSGSGDIQSLCKYFLTFCCVCAISLGIDLLFLIFILFPLITNDFHGRDKNHAFGILYHCVTIISKLHNKHMNKVLITDDYR